MNAKDFLYKEDFSDVKKAFLYYHATFKPSGITAIKIGKKGKDGYTERNFKSDAKECLKLKFPELTNQSFEELWKEMKDNFQKFNADLMTEINEEAGRIIYRVAKPEILKFILKKIKKLKIDQKLFLQTFLKNTPTEPTAYRERYTGEAGDFFVSFGLLYKGTEYDSSGNFRMENLYEFPFYFVNLKPRLLEYLTNIESKKNKKKKKSKEDALLTNSNKKEKIYRLIVEFIGKKDAKKVKIGISKFDIGTEFGGKEYKHLKFKCGNCKKWRFTIEDNENKILRCANCDALNSIFSEDLRYFE